MKDNISVSKKLTISVIVVILLIGLPIGGLTKEVKDVKIGLLLPMTGPMSSLGELNKRGFDLAVEKINREGGIKSLGGAKIGFVLADSQSDPKVAASETEKLIAISKVPIITGSYAGSLCITASAIAERHKIPYWEVSAITDVLTERGFKYFFRTIVNTTGYCGTAIDFLNALGYKKIATMAEDTIMGVTANKVFQTRAKEHGMEVLQVVTFPHSPTTFNSEILKLKLAKPQALAVAQFTNDAILFVKQMKELGLNVDLIAGTYGGPSDPQYAKALGELADYTCGVTVYNWDMQTKGSKEFVNNYLEKYQQEKPGLHPSYCYMGMLALAEVLERAGSLDADKIVEAALKTDIPETLTGYGIKFDPKTHHNIRATYASVVQWQKGELVTVWPERFASKKVISPMPKWKDR